jgi:chemosensory pili system protein ChpA (sensor histidine kinase/response regulator)
MVDVDGVGLMTERPNGARPLQGRHADCTPITRSRWCARPTGARSNTWRSCWAGAAPQPAGCSRITARCRKCSAPSASIPGDLLYPDLSRTHGAAVGAAPDDAPDYAANRARFEKALLPYLKSADPAQQQQRHAHAEAVSWSPRAQRDHKARTFWLAMQAFAELVADRRAGRRPVCQAAVRPDQPADAPPGQGQAGLPETMLRDALFFIAAAPPDSDRPRRALRQRLCAWTAHGAGGLRNAATAASISRR